MDLLFWCNWQKSCDFASPFSNALCFSYAAVLCEWQFLINDSNFWHKNDYEKILFPAMTFAKTVEILSWMTSNKLKISLACLRPDPRELSIFLSVVFSLSTTQFFSEFYHSKTTTANDNVELFPSFFLQDFFSPFLIKLNASWIKSRKISRQTQTFLFFLLFLLLLNIYRTFFRILFIFLCAQKIEKEKPKFPHFTYCCCCCLLLWLLRSR